MPFSIKVLSGEKIGRANSKLNKMKSSISSCVPALVAVVAMTMIGLTRADLPSFTVEDLVGSLPGINSTINEDLPDFDIPGSPITPEDFLVAQDDSMDSQLDRSFSEEEGDPILKAAAFEGDITNVDISSLKEMYQAAQNPHNDEVRQRNAIKESYRKWPGGVVPYVISSQYSSSERTVIAKAMSEYHQKTCIRFVPHTNEKGYIHIVKGSGCSSSVGRTGSRQTVSLGNGCVYKGIVIHEFMHAVGFWHEQSRADRDDHVLINRQNIMSGMEYNFLKYSYDKIDHLGAPYDTCSVMHYGAYAFSRNSKKTIVKLNPNEGCKLGQRAGFSDTDLKKINTLYNCPGFEHTGGSVVITTQKPAVVSTSATTISCTDTNMYCADWAKTGECQKNPAWMLKACPVACGECANKCADHHSRCSSWSSRGECTNNSEYMGIYCAKSCGMCKDANGCKDEHTNCNFWASKGYCTSSYRSYMELRCKKSCNFCTP